MAEESEDFPKSKSGLDAAVTGVPYMGPSEALSFDLQGVTSEAPPLKAGTGGLHGDLPSETRRVSFCT